MSYNSVCNHTHDKQIRLPFRRGRPILLSLVSMITDRIGLHSVLWPLLIILINYQLICSRFCLRPCNVVVVVVVVGSASPYPAVASALVFVNKRRHQWFLLFFLLDSSTINRVDPCYSFGDLCGYIHKDPPGWILGNWNTHFFRYFTVTRVHGTGANWWQRCW